MTSSEHRTHAEKRIKPMDGGIDGKPGSLWRVEVSKSLTLIGNISFYQKKYARFPASGDPDHGSLVRCREFEEG